MLKFARSNGEKITDYEVSLVEGEIDLQLEIGRCRKLLVRSNVAPETGDVIYDAGDRIFVIWQKPIDFNGAYEVIYTARPAQNR